MGLRKIFSIVTLNDRGLAYAIDKKRKQLSRLIGQMTNNTVQYGPFKGLKLSESDWWGSADKGAMLLGLYEQEIQQSIVRVGPERDVFIDLGAADGFYSIGMLKTGQYKVSHAFEMSEKGRDTISQNAQLNELAECVFIHGKADADFDKLLTPEELARAVVLIDVEGAEFEILTSTTLQRLKKSIIFVELHDWFFTDGDKKMSKLLADAKPYFNISKLTTTARDLSIYPELSLLDDSERWLVASEGRNRLMYWLRFDPI